MPVLRQRCVRALTAVAATAAALAASSGQVRAATCGNDGDPACPFVNAVVPNVISTPVRDARVTISGSSLGGVEQAVLQPDGRSLPIESKTDTSLVVDLPNGLGAGGYHIALGIQGSQTGNLIPTPIFQVAAAGAGSGALPQFSFAPPPPVGRAAAAAAPAQPSALATLPGSTSSLPAQILHGALVAIMLAGAGLVLVTLGYIYRTHSRAAQTRGLAFAALDRMLHDLWAEGEQHTTPAAVQARYSSQLAMVLAQADPAAPEVSAPRY